jgi:hypothetical protein
MTFCPAAVRATAGTWEGVVVMTQAEVRDPQAERSPGRRWGRLVALVVGVPVVAVLAVAVAFVAGHVLNARPVPSFPSLQASPDQALHGTVAYTDQNGRCVRVITASGRTGHEVLCLGEPMKTATGKEAGPQLRWLSDGRLEVTMFDMTGRPGYRGLWQKLVDVRRGTVVDVPASQVPAVPDTSSGRATVTPGGDTVAFTSDASNGKVRITLTPKSGPPRTLMSAQGPGEYTYGLDSAFWSPTWDWVAAYDGRILVVTTGPNPTTRVLVDKAWDQPDLLGFAVTATDFMAP